LLQKKFVSVCLKIFAEILEVNLSKNFAARREFVRDSRQDRARFWLPGICFSMRILLRFVLVITARVWPRGICHPGKNLCEIGGRISARFWPTEISLLSGIKTHSGQNLAESDLNVKGCVIHTSHTFGVIHTSFILL